MPRTEPFEKHSDAYDEWFEKNRDLYEAELEVIRQLLPSPEVEGVEVGVGSGRFAVPLGIKTGVEPSEAMAAKARRRGIDVSRGVAEDLPFPDGKFNLLLMVTTICFVDDVVESFKEAFRVLRPGGHIIVGFVDGESELGRRYAAEKEQSKFYGHATFFSTPTVLDHLEEAGFRIEEVRQALIPGLPPETILDDYGKGAFVAVRGTKQTG